MAVYVEIRLLRSQFLDDLVGRLRPDLVVRMRIQTTDHRPLVLKDLHVLNEVFVCRIRRRLCSRVENVLDRGRVQFGQGQIVARRKADDETSPLLGDGDSSGEREADEEFPSGSGWGSKATKSFSNT